MPGFASLSAVSAAAALRVASLDLCWVACGRLDGYFEAGGQPWDVAAGLLIATEAGARVEAAADEGAARTR